MKEMYVDYLKQKSPSERMIRRDIARTFPEHDFFKEKNGVGQESLFNVMKVCQDIVIPSQMLLLGQLNCGFFEGTDNSRALDKGEYLVIIRDNFC